MVILYVTWDIEKCKFARDPPVGVGTTERGKNMGKAKMKEVLLEIVSNVHMSSNLH